MRVAQMLGKKRKKAKPKKVAIGKKSFVIKHPGAFKAAAKKAGKSTREYAQEKKGAPGHLGRMARSAMGLMAMSGN